MSQTLQVQAATPQIISKSYRMLGGTLQHRCANCERWLPATTEVFVADSDSRHGIGSYCRRCNAERTAAYKRGHREQYLAGVAAAHKKQFEGEGLANRYWSYDGVVYIEAFDGAGNEHIVEIDQADLELVRSENTRWYVNSSGYPQRLDFMSGKTKFLHNLILDIRTSHSGRLYVDHADRDKLNNRRGNLRAVSPSQNALNRGISAKNTSGFPGVYWNKTDRSWRVQIRSGKRSIVRQFRNDYAAACRFAHDTYTSLGVPVANLPEIATPALKVAA